MDGLLRVLWMWGIAQTSLNAEWTFRLSQDAIGLNCWLVRCASPMLAVHEGPHSAQCPPCLSATHEDALIHV
eukprot:scaffold174352_cov18-Tisochrysis_lutea.AAC.1